MTRRGWPLGVVFVTAIAGAACSANPTSPSAVSGLPSLRSESAPIASASSTSIAADRVVQWSEFTAPSASTVLVADRRVSGNSATGLGDPEPPVLAPPEVNGATVRLRWTANVAGCCELPASFIIQYGFTPGFTASPARNFDTGSPAAGLTVTDVPAGTYYVRVLAFYTNGPQLSPASNEQEIRVGSSCGGTPSAPVVTAQVSGSNVFLAWTRSTSEDQYIIEANGSIVATNYANATLTYPNVGNGTYVVRVRTSNRCGESAWSEPVTFTVGSPGLPELTRQSCAQEGTLRSVSGTTSTRIDFRNNSGQTRQIFWLNYQGSRVLYSTLGAGQSVSQPTYLTHPWLVADAAGNCLGIYLPLATPAVVTLSNENPTPAPPGPGPPAPPPLPPGTFQVSPTSRNFGTVGGCPGATLDLPIAITAASDVAWTVRASGASFPGNSYYSGRLSQTNGRGSGTVTLTITIRAQTPPSWSSCNNTLLYNFRDDITIESNVGTVSVVVTYTYRSVLGA